MIRINSIFKFLLCCLFNLDYGCLALPVCGITFPCTGPVPQGIVGRIIGGENTEAGEWPWMASIIIYNRPHKEHFNCGGSLIDRTHVLTAAHCFDNVKEPNDFYIRLGSIFYERGKKYNVKRYFVHEGYESTYTYHDIALVELEEKADVCDIPICLPYADFDDKTISEMPTVIGWGRTSTDSNQHSYILKKLKQPFIDFQTCVDFYNKSEFHQYFPHGIKSDMICIGYPEGKEDTCRGDSGGPVMINHYNYWIIIGIISFGGCAKPYPSVNTRVYSYKDWIKEKLRKE